MLKRMLVLCLAAVASVSAIDLCERCWEVGGEFLYWRPCGTPYEWGADNSVTGRIDYFELKPSYDAGFRIFGATHTWDCCHLFDIDWTYLRTSDSSRTGSNGMTVFPHDGVLGTNPVAHAQLKYRYNKVSVRPGRYVASHCNSMFYTFGGVRYVDIERHQSVLAAGGGSSQGDDQKASFQGGALEVGAGADVEEPCNFWIVGRATGVMAIGERRLRQHTTLNGETTNLNHPSDTSCVLGAELRLGVKYRYECSWFWLMAEIGYELDHYFNALQLMAPAEAATGQVPATQYVDAGFGGLYVNASVRF